MTSRQSPSSRHVLRRQLRQRRRALSSQLRCRYDKAISRHVLKHPLFLRSRHIAVYLPNDGEVNLDYFMQHAWKRGKRLYLPVLQPIQKRLWFFPYTRQSTTRNNRFGIAEPRRGKIRPPHALHLVLAPLVGFDRHGNRLGMGGGFYDRTFARQRTLLLGIAYSFQELEQLDPAPWDIPLWGVVTEQGVIKFDDEFF
jgi:5-formyltetrahydrofolate cyclo-ligase